MTEAPCDTTIDRRGVAVITLRRPAVHNAFDERLIAELGDAFVARCRRPKSSWHRRCMAIIPWPLMVSSRV